MNKILIALTLAGFTYLSAEAQNKPLIACEAPKGKVCRKTSSGVSCYKTPYAEDFKICKGDYGYFVCCEPAAENNATHPKLSYIQPFDGGDNMQNLNEAVVLESKTPAEYTSATRAATVPQSQSYIPYSNSACVGTCYARKAKPCYGGNNVAMLNQAPYNGCPTPAYDGPDANKNRNVNSNNTVDNLAPINGRPQ
jgi:hypothetical protein